jgi:hypothetical protein
MTTPCKVVTTALLLGLLSRGALGQGAGKSDPGTKDKAPAGGYVVFVLEGLYAADCRVTWKEQVKDKTGKSNLAGKEWTWKKATLERTKTGELTRATKRCELPPRATAVKVSVRVYVSRDILSDVALDPKEFAAPPRVTYTLKGTVLSPRAYARLAK